MHVLWFILMVGSFMTLICNNVRVVLSLYHDPNHYKRSSNKEKMVVTFVYHIINYVIFYFSLTNFIGHMVARY